MHVSSLVRWFSVSFTQLHHHRRKSLLPTNSTTKHLYTYNTSFWSKLRALSMRPCAILPRNSRHKSLPKSLNKLSTFVDGYSSRKTLRVSQIVCLVFGCWIGGALCWRFSWLFAFVCLNVGKGRWADNSQRKPTVSNGWRPKIFGLSQSARTHTGIMITCDAKTSLKSVVWFGLITCTMFRLKWIAKDGKHIQC